MNRRLVTYPLVALTAAGCAAVARLQDLGGLGRYGFAAAVLVVCVSSVLVWSERLIAQCGLSRWAPFFVRHGLWESRGTPTGLLIGTTLLGIALVALWPLPTAAFVLGAVGLLYVLARSVSARTVGELRVGGPPTLRIEFDFERERAELDRRLRVPIAAVGEIDPTQIGVDAAAQTILAGETVPEYVPREVDEQLQAAIRAAADGSGPGLVVVVGASKVGKSRALFEALRAQKGELELVAPVDGDSLRSLLTSPLRASGERAAPVALWLDDLEPFLNQGLTLQTLREWLARNPGSIVAGTYGGKGSELASGSSSSALATTAGEILQHACQIALAATTIREVEPVLSHLPSEIRQPWDPMPQAAPDVLDAVERHGLAAYVVAAPPLERKLSTHRHAPGEPECPEGAALVYAAIDWARCGRDPIATETLRDLWRSYLPADVAVTDEGFDAGLEWALRPVAGMVALLQRVPGGFHAFDYVVRFVSELPNAPAPRDETWASALRGADGPLALAIATRAYEHGRYDDTITALRSARAAPDDEVASLANVNLELLLKK